MVYRPRAMGGLGLPNLWLYYLAARLLQLAQWHTPPHGIPWLRFERISIAPYYLPGLLWAKAICPKDISTLNAVVGQSLHLWSLYKHKLFLITLGYPLLSGTLHFLQLSQQFYPLDLERPCYPEFTSEKKGWFAFSNPYIPSLGLNSICIYKSLFWYPPFWGCC